VILERFGGESDDEAIERWVAQTSETGAIALDEQLRARSLSAQRVSGCSWEVVPDPERRHGELLREYLTAHHCIPLWNDPQRLPTS